MKLHLIETGTFKLDGGAMFGVVPKLLWQKLLPPDDENRIELAMRCLLIETADRLILVDTGIGNKNQNQFIRFFSPKNTGLLIDNLTSKGFSTSDVTDVILTHLHFDHAGGAVRYDENNVLIPTFPKATYWSNATHWESALHPNLKEAPSFIKDNFIPLQESGQLKFIPCTDAEYRFLPDLQIKFLHGHTHGMMLLIIHTKNQIYVYCADLIPTVHHLSLSYIIAYDIQPLVTIKEKKEFIEKAILHNYALILEHDLEHACVKLIRNDDGKVQAIPFNWTI
jgi:glyoxylase-like metal-dependent hydrolase (beta-lactamase superfamily II)